MFGGPRTVEESKIFFLKTSLQAKRAAQNARSTPDRMFSLYYICTFIQQRRYVPIKKASGMGLAVFGVLLGPTESSTARTRTHTHIQIHTNT
ncbi:hypothetical protein AMEX_G19263 [Astyanax mexicanus]|uniref:Uncharacterized protein n=1 Tax=Astyanax mexicanus TaxID=7994 RepID=A0A8T2L4H3_ASTMX|nr:hypothetical protein AMEX_G19263 [Astyanax mexicanus]